MDDMREHRQLGSRWLIKEFLNLQTGSQWNEDILKATQQIKK